MGRFYADLAALQRDELLDFSLQYTCDDMPLVDSLFKSRSTTDDDGDVVMTEALSGSPVSPLKDRFGMEWLRSDSNNPMKNTLHSPVSPPNTARKLSVSTASPTSYFLESSNLTASSGYGSNNYSQTQKPRFRQVVLPSPPSKPLNWVWQCHMCRSRYPLSVTRRCLIDGHYYCSGDTSQRNMKRKRKHQSCTSEFDYVGWQDWGQWRRKCTALRAFANGKTAPKLTGCDGCSYPSQCRYENRPASESLDFERFISDDDITAMKNREVEAIVSPDENEPDEDLLTAARDKENNSSDIYVRRRATKLTQLELLGEQKLKHSLINGHENSRRSRFYSTLTGSLSSTGLSPTEEKTDPFTKGKFDPRLPSVNTTSATSVSGNGASHRSSHRDEEMQAMESKLKSVLKDNKIKLPLTQDSIQQSPTGRVQRNHDQRTKNSAKQLMQDWEHEGENEDDSSSKIRLTRNTSQQSLLSDWYKPRKSRDGSGDVYRPASDIDIASFLRLRTVRRSVDDSAQPRDHSSSKAYSSSNFEDIKLSPVERRLSLFAVPLPDNGEANQRLSGQADDGKIIQSRRPSSTFGFSAFNFNRQ